MLGGLAIVYCMVAEAGTSREVGWVAYRTGDYAMAYDIWLGAAQAGDRDARILVAALLAEGRGVTINRLAADQWLARARDLSATRKTMLMTRLAAEKGISDAQFDLGNMYLRGIGVERNESKAFEQFRESALQDHREAQFNLGILLASGRGIEKDLAKARTWYQRAAVQELPQAQYNLAIMLLKGEGGHKDNGKALTWIRAAAMDNYPPAQNQLGALYESGNIVERNAGKAVRWYQRAAVAGDANARLNLNRLLGGVQP